MLSWRLLQDSQKRLDTNTNVYDYIKTYNIFLDKRESYEKLKTFPRAYEQPQNITPRRIKDWDVKIHKDPFIYDKLSYANSPEYFCSKLSFLNDIENGSRVLDLGCGAGVNASYLLFRGIDVVGIDFSSSNLRVLNRKAEKMGKDIELVCGNLENICISDEAKFDYLVESEIFRRKILDEEKSLKECLKLLKGNGKFYILDYSRFDIKPRITPDYSRFGFKPKKDAEDLSFINQFIREKTENMEVFRILEDSGYKTELVISEPSVIEKHCIFINYLLKAF